MRAAARRRLAEQQARAEAAKYLPDLADVGEVEDPLGELLRVANQMIMFKDALAERVSQMSMDEWRYESSQRLEQIRAEVSLFQAAARDVHRIIESMAKLDLEARRTRIAERDAMLLAHCLDRIFERLGLRDDPRVQAIVSEELYAIAGTEEPSEPYLGRSRPAALPRAR